MASSVSLENPIPSKQDGPESAASTDEGQAHAGADETTEQRTLASFVVLAYNQESVVADAVRGALMQSYRPLEIILSDDDSSDCTFQVMLELAKAYQGTAQVVVRRSVRNRGLLGHLNDIASTARGEVLILAAGDDVSLPNRTTELMSVFDRWPETYAVCSDYNVRTSNGVASRKIVQQEVREFSLLRMLLYCGGYGGGATYAYRKQCLRWPSLLPENGTIEDKVLPLRAALLGRVAYVSEPLVEYRTNNIDSQTGKYTRMIDSSLSSIANAGANALRARSQMQRGSTFRFALLGLLWRMSIDAVEIEHKLYREHAVGTERIRRLIKFAESYLFILPLRKLIRIGRLVDFYSPLKDATFLRYSTDKSLNGR